MIVGRQRQHPARKCRAVAIAAAIHESEVSASISLQRRSSLIQFGLPSQAKENWQRWISPAFSVHHPADGLGIAIQPCTVQNDPADRPLSKPRLAAGFEIYCKGEAETLRADRHGWRMRIRRIAADPERNEGDHSRRSCVGRHFRRPVLPTNSFVQDRFRRRAVLARFPSALDTVAGRDIASRRPSPSGRTIAEVLSRLRNP